MTQPLTLDQAEQLFLTSLRAEGRSPDTLRFYTDSLESFRRFLARPTVTVADIFPQDCREYMANLHARGSRPATVDDRRRALARFFTWLLEEEEIPTSPMARIKPVRVPVMVIPSYTHEDIDKLLNNCSTRSHEDVRDKALILMLYDTGLRLREIAGLEIDDIDWNTGRIKVFGKGAKERFVGMGSRLQRALLRWIRVRPGDGQGPLWSTRWGSPFKPEAIRSMVKRRLRDVGVSGPRAVHRFRNSFAVSFLEDGGHPDDLRELLGHSTDQMVRRYTRDGAQNRAVKAHKSHSPADRLR